MQIVISKIIRSRRKTISISIDEAAAVTVRAPLGMSEASIREFVRKHSDWVAEKTEKARKRQAEKEARSGRYLMYRGRNLEIDYVGGEKYALKIDGDKLLVSQEIAGAEKEYIHRLLGRNAKAYLQLRTRELASLVGHEPSTIRLSSARRSWGSCNARKKSINLNWRLIMAPPETADYVIIHELCHLRHPNHSRAFWQEVERFMPDWKSHRKWLRENGNLLDV